MTAAFNSQVCNARAVSYHRCQTLLAQIGQLLPLAV